MNKNKNPKISIILPVLNEAGMVEMTVLSLLHNTDYDNYEILVVDQGSDDGCCDFLQRIEFKNYDNVRYIDASYSQGLSMTKNIGAKNAKGDILVFSDAHMGFQSGWIYEFLDEIYKDENIGMVTCSLPNLLQYPKKNISQNYFHFYTIADYGLGSLWRINTNMIPQESPAAPGGFMFVKKSVFDFLEGFDEGMRSWGFEDLEFSMRMWLSGYKIIAKPYLKIFHMYRTQFHNYTVKQEDITYNFLRFALTCFNENRQREILNNGKNRVGFVDNLVSLINDDKFWERKRRLEKKFKYNDQWYFDKFKDVYVFDKFVYRDLNIDVSVEEMKEKIKKDIDTGNVLNENDINIFVEKWNPIVNLTNYKALFLGYNTNFLLNKINVNKGYVVDFYNLFFNKNNIEYINTDLETINLPDNSVSAAFTLNFLHYTKNIKNYFKEIHRVLNNRCYLYLGVKIDTARSDIKYRYMPQDILRECESVGFIRNRENYHYVDKILYYTLILENKK